MKISLKKNKNNLIIASVIGIILIGSVSYIVSANKNIKKWNDKVYPGIFVGNVDLSGKTLDEAKKILKDDFENNINKKEIIVKVEGSDKVYKTTYKEIDPKYNLDTTAEKAFNYGKNENIFVKNFIIKGDEKVEIPLDFHYNEKKLSKLEDKIIDKISNKAKNATITISENGSKKITEGKDGKVVDKKELDEELKRFINGDITEKTDIVVKTKIQKPTINKSDLEKINGVMGEFSTSYGSSNYSRSTNIAVATEFVNGTLLMPGEVFSYSDATQKDKSKYKESNVYINNKVEKDIGGGICQISSALYRATMRANIRPEERHNHSLTVGYEKPGMDATVAWGYLDFKIKNTYDFPIYIAGYTKNKVATFKIYGNVDALDGKTYDMTNEIVKTISPTEKIINDPNLEEGKRIVESSGQTGYVAKGYLITYKNGKEIKRELISTDNYNMRPIEIRVGTKKPEPKPEPLPVPEVKPEEVPATPETPNPDKEVKPEVPAPVSPEAPVVETNPSEFEAEG